MPSAPLVQAVDLLFFLCVLILAWLAVEGSVLLSAQGAVIDSDLATYAQGMCGAAHPGLFAADPVLHTVSSASSIWNLESALASLLTPGDDFATGLLRAGGVTIACYLLSWYIFGRWLFGRRDVAFLLTLFMSVTVWVGLGTFWGIMHSNPVPRVLHSAFFPLMLMLAIQAWDTPSLRPVALLVAGLGMWLHGVSALNCGAMFFVAFFVHKPSNLTVGGHIFWLALSLLTFFIPVLAFLWPSLFQGRSFTAEELTLFREFFTLRWMEDYSDIPGSILAFLSPTSPAAPILYPGLLSLSFLVRSPQPRIRAFARMVIPFLLALCAVIAFSLWETHYAAKLGRVPMGHELVRGIKFLVPLGWISLCGVLLLIFERIPRPCTISIVLAAFIVVMGFSNDTQLMAAEYALSKYTGIRLPLVSEAERKQEENIQAYEALTACAKYVPEGEGVFCLEDSMMALRYLAKRPLLYSFKDGYVHFYNKDIAGCRTWLAYAKLTQEGPEGVRNAFEKSGAMWYLAAKRTNSLLDPAMKIVWENAEWMLARK